MGIRLLGIWLVLAFLIAAPMQGDERDKNRDANRNAASSDQNRDADKSRDSDNDAAERLGKAAEVFREVMDVPDKAIPEELIGKAECVAVIPSMIRGGFIVGGRWGKGAVTCRQGNQWSAPAMIEIAGGSFGAQIGGEAVDLVMLVMNEAGKSFLYRDKVTLGGGVSASAGPVGRAAAAETNAALRSHILTYSRSRGLFAGATVQGATLRPDKDANEELYGKELNTREILTGNMRAPAAAEPFLAAIRTHGEVRARR